jgi:hypothetical protein
MNKMKQKSLLKIFPFCFSGYLLPLLWGTLRKNHALFVSPVKTGVQNTFNPLKALDSCFRRNDIFGGRPESYLAFELSYCLLSNKRVTGPSLTSWTSILA